MLSPYLRAAGMSRAQQGFHEEALEWFSKAQKIAPDYSPSYLEAGLLLQRMHRPEEGLAMLATARQLNPPQAELQQAMEARGACLQVAF